jgi:hypothetical protein
MQGNKHTNGPRSVVERLAKRCTARAVPRWRSPAIHQARPPTNSRVHQIVSGRLYHPPPPTTSATYRNPFRALAGRASSHEAPAANGVGRFMGLALRLARHAAGGPRSRRVRCGARCQRRGTPGRTPSGGPATALRLCVRARAALRLRLLLWPRCAAARGAPAAHRAMTPTWPRGEQKRRPPARRMRAGRRPAARAAAAA